MRKITYIAIVMLLPLTFGLSFALEFAPDYRIKLTKNTGGLNIAVNTFAGPAVTVGLENRSGKTALCSASFVSYPHPPSLDEKRSTTIAAGKRATLAYPARKLGGIFATAFVDVKCSAQ